MAFETTATIKDFGGNLLKLSHQSKSTGTEMKLNLFVRQTDRHNTDQPYIEYILTVHH